MIRCAAALCLAVAAPAQELAIELRLAADADRSGPAAWTWCRADVLPRLRGWPEGLDPFGALALIATPDGLVSATTAARADADAHYASAVLRCGDAVLLRATAGRLGAETWRCERGAPWPPRIAALVRLLDLGTPGAQTLDVGPLAAHLARGVGHTDELFDLAVSRGAVECGEVRFVATDDAGVLVVRGESRGGLLLPAAIALLAEVGGDLGALASPREHDERERWQLRAFAGRDDARAEAAAQLARLGGAPELDVLERLLYAGDGTRAHAMDGLIRARAASALPALLRAADPGLPATDGLAEAALVNLWPAASKRERAAAAPLVAASAFASIRRHADTAPPAAAARSNDVIGMLLVLAVVLVTGHEALRRRETVTSRRS